MGFYKNDATAASNTSVNGIAIAGSSSPANIDNALRELTAQGKQFALDLGGATTVAGTADAIAITLNDSVADAYFDGILVAFIAGADNTVTGPTANVNAIGAKTIKKALATDGAEAALAVGDIQSGGLYMLRYRSAWASAAGAWQLIDMQHSGSDIVNDTTPQLGGPLDTNSQPIYLSKGADIASATALALGTDGNYFDVTGTTTITSIGTRGGAGKDWVKLHFDDALTLTHHATDLILPGGANITTAAGDEAEFVEYAAGDWRCTSYVKADGTAVVASSPGLTRATAQATTSGTSKTFTGIPSGTTKIEIIFNEVSFNSTDDLLVQIGDSGGLETSSYTSMSDNYVASASSTSGFIMDLSTASAAMSGIMTLVNVSGNIWVSSHSASAYLDHALFGGGAKTLSAELDRVAILGSAGGTFDSGSVTIVYQ